MKITIKKSFAVVMAFVMCVSVLFGMNLSAFAADTNTVDYVYSGKYVYNWGTREEEATFLSPMALEFYSDNNVSLSELLELSGSSSESGVPSSALYKELHKLMESNHTYTNSYEAVKNLCKYTDCQDSGGKISSFYSGKEIGPEWNSSEWNREHTWPNSKGDLAGNGEDDIMMLRPTATSENGSRSNKAYGESSGYFNPNIGSYDLRGDVARIILYQYVRWECTNTGSSYNPNGIFGTSGVIESQDILLDWIEADPVDTWELGRNDAVEAITGTRNVFVDYPELAFDLFNEDVPADYTSPSDGTSVEGTTGTGGSDNTGDATTSTPGAEIVFNLGANGAATHADGSSKTSYTETVDGYTLNITGGSSFYTGARDAKGNSAIKMGTSSKTGSFSMTVPDDVASVIINVAQYKANTTKITVNGTAHTITTASDSGAYTPITVDTTQNKTISFTTVSGGYRCMIDSITFVVAGSSDGGDTTDENKIFVDQDGLVISGPDSAFPENVDVTATKLTAGDGFNTAQTALADKASQFTLYDITATVGGAAVQPSGEITITLDIPNGYDPDHVCIAYISNDGTVEELETSSVDKAANTVSATLEHFSLYAVIDTSNVSTDDGDDSGDDNTGDNTQIVEVEATITFDANKTQRVSLSNSQQVWANDGLTFTNNKASSTSNVADYSNPVRLYAKSSITLEHTGPLKRIVFVAQSSSYANTLKTSIGTVSGATVSVDGSNVTVTFDEAVDSFTVATLSAQVQLKSITATIVETLSGYTITPQSSNTAYGTVSLDGKYITATPATGYEVAGYEIISGTATVTRNGNVFTVEATSDVTIKINFAARTQYNVTFKEMGTTTSTQTAYSGDSITLPTITSGDYTVVGWVAAEIDGETATRPTVYNAGSDYTVTANTTFYALYSRTAAGGSGESNVFTKHTGAITEGEYLIVGAYSSSTATPYGALKAGITSNRFQYTDVTVSSDGITTTDATIIWKVEANGSYWTFYNESTSKYAGGTGTASRGGLLDSVTDYAKWNITGTSSHVFENVGNKTKGVNYTLRRNGTYGFACYAASTGTAPTLYKRTAAALTTYYFTGAAEAEYTVTANANNAEYGTVSVVGTTISATPNAGYTVSGYNITSGTATVTREGNTFFVTPSSNVTITINFEALTTYTVTFVENGVEVDFESTYSGGIIKLPEYSGELDEYTTFNGWAEQENETDSAKIYAAKATFAVTKNVTLYAQFTVTAPPVVEESDHYFVKVTEDQTDWSGTYLIVYEEGNKALNGAIGDKLDIAGNNIDVQIADGKIAALNSTMAAYVIVEKIDGGYTLRTKGGLFFGSESDTNSLLNNATKTYVNTISIDADGNAVITGEGGAILRYNSASDQNRFRFYKTSSYTGQQPIALYKLDVAEISGAQVTVGADLSVNYYVDGENFENIADGDLTMRFTIGEDTPVTVNGKLVGNQYVFTFTGLAPQRMGDNIKAELIYKGTVIGTKDEYSVKQNAINLLSDNPSDELKQFISDMLYYGAAAQKYSGYNKNNLVTDGVTGLGDPLDEPLTEDYNRLYLSQPTGDARFKSATVWFDAVNKLIVKVNNPNSEAIKVYVTLLDETRTELAYNETVGGYMTDAIKVTDFHAKCTFELCDASGTLLQTLEYSVNSYAYSKQSSTNPAMVELALALFRLGQSAENL